MKSNYVFIALALILMSFAPAFGQLDRAFVATTGADSGTCGARTAPCRDFNAALARTNAGGEIIVLDSGIYGSSSITISKAVTLAAAPGVHADVYNADNSTRLTVNAGSSDIVILRNLYITGKPGGTNFYGINVTSVGTLQIENCVVDHFNGGIYTSGLQSSAQIFIKDTIVKNNFNSGISITTGSGLVRAEIEHCQLINNGAGGAGEGVSVDQGGRVVVRDSVAANNQGAGFGAFDGDLNIDRCESSNNGYGVYASNTANAGSSGVALVSNSMITNNKYYGFGQSGNGVLNSLGNNVVRRNGTNLSGTITSISGN